MKVSKRGRRAPKEVVEQIKRGPCRLDARLVAFNALSCITLRGNVFVGDPALELIDPQRVERHDPISAHLEVGSDPSTHRWPFVSCVMVTRNRFEQAQLATNCFRRQTWQCRELVIFDTSEDDTFRQWVASLCDSRIKFTHLPGLMDSLGDMRNRAIEAAHGTHICQWDDDDLSHPARLEAQVASVRTTGAQVSMLLREMMWVPAWNGLSITRRRGHENTLLAEKAVLPSYPSLARFEDTPVVEHLMERQRVAYLDQPELYVYVSHGTNTWDEEHMLGIWKSSTNHFLGARYRWEISSLKNAYDFQSYERLNVLNSV